MKTENKIKKPGNPEKYDRNKEIYLKKKRGMTYRELVPMYGLAQNTLLKIFKRWEARELER